MEKQNSRANFDYMPLPQGEASSAGKVEMAGLRTYRTNLRPNTLGGVFCPGGTIVNHERRSYVRSLVLVIEVLLHFAVLFVHFARVTELLAYERSVLDSEQDMTSEDFEAIKENIMNEQYLSEGVRCVTDCVVNAWLVWNVGIRLFYFAFYRPRFQDAAYKPSLFTKMFFPLATVYYHEENEVCNPHFALTYLCGFLYPALCYKPSYEVEEVQV